MKKVKAVVQVLRRESLTVSLYSVFTFKKITLNL